MMSAMDLAAISMLTSGEGWGLLQSLPPYDEARAMSLQGRLREAGFAPELVAAALTQSRLRGRAREKFGGFADGMLFTDDGLEQATRLAVAARHAERFRRAGVHVVHDLGCGIGADAMGFAGLDLGVRAVDVDEVSAAVAAVNLRHWSAARVEHGRAEEVRLPAGEAARHTGAWLDPSRRLRGAADITGRSRRVFSLAGISPSWEQVCEVARRLPATGAKLSPSFPHRAVPPGAEAQWTSWEGEVLECGLWWGPLAQTRGRSAAVCRADRSTHLVTEAQAAGARPPLRDVGDLGSWLYEPDRAVIRAGLTGALVRAVDGAELDVGVGYVSGDRVVELGWARRFGVLEVMPYNVKALRAWLRDHDVGRVTIKKRGVPIDPDGLRRALRCRGAAGATLVLTRIRSQPHVLVVRAA